MIRSLAMQQTREMYLAVGGFAALVVVVGIIAIFVARGAKRKAKAWMDFAQTLGMRGSGTWPEMRMTGSIDGISVGIEHHRQITYDRDYSSADRSTDRKVKQWCQAWAGIPGGAGDLQIAEEGLFAKLAKLVGSQDIKTGDPKFDKRFIVKSSNTDSAVARLHPKARAALLSLEDTLRGEITVEDGSVKWKKPNSSVTPERALEIMKQLAQAARAFEISAAA